MGQNLAPKSLVPAAYIPTAPRTGSEGGYLYRVKNMILRGATGHDYVEVYGGNKNLSEDIPELAASGVGDYVIGALTIPGLSGPAYRAELRPGQFIYTQSVPRCLEAIEEVLANALIAVSRPIPVTGASRILLRPPIIFEVNKKRGTLITGSAVQFDKGTIICAGSGTLRLNGSVLAGTSLAATKRPKIALFDPTTSTYTVFTLGMTTPATLTAAAIAGGVKNMQAGVYSLFVCPARKATLGYNNPSPKAEVTLATGDQVRLTIPATDTTNGQDAWRIYASTFTEQGGVNGPWYFVKQINSPGDVAAAGGTYDLEWNDAEISGNERLTQDNDPPPECEFVATVSGYPVYVSCQGPGYTVSISAATNANPVVLTTSSAIPHYFTTGQQVTISGGTGAWAAINGTWTVMVISATTFSIPVNSTALGALAGTIVATSLATSPGPFIVPAKPNNIEAAPLKFAVSPSPPETIIGCISAQGRLYLMTANTLQVAEFINFPINDPNIPPLTIRPLWRAGFKTPYQLCFVDGTLYGYTTQGPTRSVSYGDEGGEEHTFAAAVREITNNWIRAHVLVAHDPVNNAVCFFHSDDSTTEAGFHTTRVLMYGLDRQAWIGDIVLESATRDMVVTGVATVSGRLEFIAGGVEGATDVWSTFHFDSRIELDGGAGTSVFGYISWQFTDDGSEDRDKAVKSIRVTAKLSEAATAGIHGAGAGEIIPVTTLEAGNSGSKSGSIPLIFTTAVGQGARIPLNVPNLGVWTARIDDTWSGSGIKFRVDEVVVERSVGGVRR